MSRLAARHSSRPVTGSPAEVRPRRLSSAALAFANAGVASVVFTAFALRFRFLWDADSYLHPAIARHYRLNGVFEAIPWGRFSMTSWGGDKDFLFHVALIPFTCGDPPTSARLAIAAMNALLIGALTFVFARREAWWAIGLSWWLYLTATPFLARVIRLRPEVVSLILLLLVCEAAARRRWAICGALGAVYTLSYTPFHLMIGLAAVWFLAFRLERGRWEWRLPVWMWGGVVAGLVVRPHPVENFRLWYAQNVTFYSLVGKLDIGQEVDAPRLAVVIPLIAGWLIGMVALALATHKRDGETADDDGVSRWEWIVYAITAAVFIVLYSRMGKMSIYVYPLALAALLRWCAAHRRRIGLWAAPLLVASIAIAFPAIANPTLLSLLGLRGEVLTETDLEAFGHAMPPHARVAATWSDAELFSFWAPQGRYLNIYDSTFMYVPYPRLWEAQAALFAGDDPDVVRTMRGPLESDFLAFDATGMRPRFLERVRHDPRLRVVYGGYNVLLAYDAGGEGAFVTDWNGAKHGAFVEIAGPSRCVTLRHVAQLAQSQRFEFTPWGNATLTVDGVQRVEVRKPVLAVLGHGVEVNIAEGEHSIEVRTCAASGRNGFYFLRR